MSTRRSARWSDIFLQPDEARVELTHNETRAAADRYTSQITIWTNGQILRAEESTSDIFASIDASADKMYRQIRRFKGRRYHTKRRASAAASAEAEASSWPPWRLEAEEEEEEEAHIIRRKEFLLQPMNEEEAMAQMELLGHDFFVYYDPDANGVNVLYDVGTASSDSCSRVWSEAHDIDTDFVNDWTRRPRTQRLMGAGPYDRSVCRLGCCTVRPARLLLDSPRFVDPRHSGSGRDPLRAKPGCRPAPE